MVRIIAGTLLEVGEGKLEPSDMEDIIASKDRGKAGKTAVARGLRLVEIKYENEKFRAPKICEKPFDIGDSLLYNLTLWRVI